MILNEGLNKIRDLLNTNVDEVDWGTGTSVSESSDTGLESEVAGLDATSSNVVKDKTLNVTGVLVSTSGNGSAISESVVRFSDGTDLNRNTFTPISKTDSKEIHNVSTFVLTQG